MNALKIARIKNTAQKRLAELMEHPYLLKPYGTAFIARVVVKDLFDSVRGYVGSDVDDIIDARSICAGVFGDKMNELMTPQQVSDARLAEVAAVKAAKAEEEAWSVMLTRDTITHTEAA